MDQQFSAAKLGMWIFLVTELLLFGGMFVAYAVLRMWYPETFASADQYLDTYLGAANTIVLLTSSLTVVLGVNAIQRGKQNQLVAYLWTTVLLAGVFMVIKYFEWSHKFHEGMFPGQAYAFEEFASPHAPIFFSLYYVMTGIHGVHVVLGMAVLTYLAIRAAQGRYDSTWYTPVEMTGLYWHLVDIIWIFLFPLFYLIG